MANKKLAESHRRQFNGEDYQAVAVDLATVDDEEECQERLFREFSKGQIAPTDKAEPARICANCVSFPNKGRSRGECVLLGVIKNCTSTCAGFRPRKGRLAA